MRNNFQRMHPVFQMSFYILILLACFLLGHPLELFFLWLGVCLSLMWNRFRIQGISYRKDIPLVLMPFLIAFFVALINALIRNFGANIIYTFPNGRIVTWDAFLEGYLSGFRLGTSLLWLKHMQENLEMSKILFLVKKSFPSFGLLLTLSLKYLPRFTHEARELSFVHRLAEEKQNRKYSLKSIAYYANLLSSLSAWGLEDSMYTAQMMEQRGFGLTKQTTSYQLYQWKKKDTIYLFIVLLILLLRIIVSQTEAMYFTFQPFLYFRPWSVWQGIGFLTAFCLGLVPWSFEWRRY